MEEMLLEKLERPEIEPAGAGPASRPRQRSQGETALVEEEEDEDEDAEEDEDYKDGDEDDSDDEENWNERGCAIYDAMWVPDFEGMAEHFEEYYDDYYGCEWQFRMHIRLWEDDVEKGKCGCRVVRTEELGELHWRMEGKKWKLRECDGGEGDEDVEMGDASEGEEDDERDPEYVEGHEELVYHRGQAWRRE